MNSQEEIQCLLKPFILVSARKPYASEFKKIESEFGYKKDDKPLRLTKVKTRDKDPSDREIIRFDNFEEAQKMKTFEVNAWVILEENYVDVATYNLLSELEEAASEKGC